MFGVKKIDKHSLLLFFSKILTNKSKYWNRIIFFKITEFLAILNIMTWSRLIFFRGQRGLVVSIWALYRTMQRGSAFKSCCILFYQLIWVNYIACRNDLIGLGGLLMDMLRYRRRVEKSLKNVLFKDIVQFQGSRSKRRI